MKSTTVRRATVAALALVLTSTMAYSQQATATAPQQSSRASSQEPADDPGTACARGAVKGTLSTFIVAFIIDMFGGGGIATATVLSGGWAAGAITGCANAAAAKIVDSTSNTSNP